jgi:hypothetical protein
LTSAIARAWSAVTQRRHGLDARHLRNAGGEQHRTKCEADQDAL